MSSSNISDSTTALANNALHKSNADLTIEEKEAKRDIKKEMKRKRRQASLDRKLRHAIIIRKDPIVEQQAREELAAMGAEVVLLIRICPKEQAARDFVLNLYVRLKQSQLPDGGSKRMKHAQTNVAVTLLRHMTKGTQDKNMFDNEDALWGYARQKFQERAMLVYTSFAILDPTEQPTELAQEECTRRKHAWEALTSVKSICSVGCGPGCDAAGVLAFLHQFSADSKLTSMLLLDFAMDKWQTVLTLLEPILKPSLVETMECTSGDITKPLTDDANSTLRTQQDVDLYLFSYILTETRGKWEEFLKELVATANSNTLFFFAEPTPWQLHQLRKMLPSLQYIWVDSSMNQSTTLQAMDGRLGPGILLARKP